MKMSLLRTFLFATVCIIVAGCSDGGPKVARVVGTITYDGEPLSGATVVFSPDSGARMGNGGTDGQGRYDIGTYEIDDGAILGKHRVAIVKRGPRRLPPEGTPGRGMLGGPSLAGLPLIAEKYLQTETSGLTADVENRRKNVIDFELKSNEN
jgi:hypothetical protein